MFRVAIIEFYSNIIRTIRWWKVILFILMTLSLIAIFSDIENRNMIFIYWIALSFYLIGPRVSKLNYLLPSDSRSRSLYLVYSSIGAAIFISLWFGIVYTANIILHNYGIVDALKLFFEKDLIIILLITSLCVGTTYQTNIKNTKPNKLKQFIFILLIIYSTTYVTIFDYFIYGYWYIASTVAAYFSIFLGIYYFYTTIKDCDTCYENQRKPIKFSL